MGPFRGIFAGVHSVQYWRGFRARALRKECARLAVLVSSANTSSRGVTGNATTTPARRQQVGGCLVRGRSRSRSNMKQVKLIGYPHARWAEVWEFPGHPSAQFGAEVFTPTTATTQGAGAGVILDGVGWWSPDAAPGVAPWRESWGILPPASALASMGYHQSGDITGASGAKQRKARPVGAGVDPEVQQAQALQAWLEGAGALPDDVQAVIGKRARLTACASFVVDQFGICTVQGIPERIFRLVGGAGYPGRRVNFHGAGMVASAAQYLFAKRGVKPCDTSLEEAAATATARAWSAWLEWSYCCGDVWSDTARRYLAGQAWRAAFGSLSRDEAQGLTGRRAGQVGGASLVPLSEAELHVARASLQRWAEDRQGRIFFDPDQDQARALRSARRRVARWLWGALGCEAGKGRLTNGQWAALRAARARWSVLVRVIHGRDWATAARGAGFASGKSAAESFRAGKVWARLRLAVRGHLGQRERRLLAVRLRAARAAVRAIKRQRKASAGAGVAGPAYLARGYVSAPVVVPSGAATVAFNSALASEAAAARVGAVKVTRPAGRRVIITQGRRGAAPADPQAAEWASATAERGAAGTAPGAGGAGSAIPDGV